MLYSYFSPKLLCCFVLLHKMVSCSLAMSIKASTTSHHQTTHNDVHHIASLDDIGITSILPVPSTSANYYYIGTKRGKVKQVIIPEDLQDTMQQQQRIQIQDIDDANGKSLKPYPVFSMMSVPNHDNDDIGEHNYDLLTGGGDRYVTVWRRNNEGEWTVVDQLGPHTGWVKDLASCHFSTNVLQSDPESINDERIFIFSIGCNCIEIWSAIDGRYKHIHKLQIESSVEMGCTLSSDLLCLATYSGNDDNDIGQAKESYLFAGGVDGCIHRWTLHNNKFLNAKVLSAHDGRVNAIAVCQTMNVLISVGSDGYFHCREIRDSNPSEWRVVSLSITDHCGVANRTEVNAQSTQRKATSLCIVHEESKQAIIAVGTSCGYVALVNIMKSDDNTVHASVLKDTSVADEEGQVIHALCSKRYKHSCRITIGHSNGLSIWDVPIKLL